MSVKRRGNRRGAHRLHQIYPVRVLRPSNGGFELVRIVSPKAQIENFWKIEQSHAKRMSKERLFVKEKKEVSKSVKAALTSENLADEFVTTEKYNGY